MTDSRDYSLALEEARRNLDSLNARLADLRSRALQLVSVGGLAAAFVGGLSALNKNGFSLWDLGALASFALIVLACLVIWWPRNLKTSQRPWILVEWAEVPAATRQRMNRSLALWLGDHYDINQKIINRMLGWFCFALILLTVEVVCLAVGLWTH